jgi:hypothetical protein
MTDKEYKQEKARILKFIKKWRPAGFTWFKVHYDFIRELKDGNETSSAAECSCRWEYKEAFIKFYLPMFIDMPDDRVEAIVVHEHAHILVSPIQDFSTDETRQMTEFATSLVAEALVWSAENVR